MGTHPDSLHQLSDDLDRKFAAAWPAEEPPRAQNWIGYLALFVGGVAGVKIGAWMTASPAVARGIAGLATGVGAFFASARWVFGPALGRPPADQREIYWEIYETVVRPRIAAYLKTHHLTLAEFVTSIGAREDVRAKYESLDFFQLVATDMPLAFHSLGMRLTIN
jgi:hypothetical protein